MPTDLSLSREITREQLDRYRHPGMHFSDKGGLEVTVARGMFEHLLRVAEAHLAEPARIAAARQEGYREGVADAKQAAGFAAWRHEGDDAHSRGMDAGARHQVAECVKAIVALSPLPAEPSAPVAEGDRVAALREAGGIHRYRDKQRIAALEAENAKLRERNSGLEEGLRPFAVECAEWVDQIHLLPNETVPEIKAPSDDAVAAARFTLGDLRRARALLQGGPDAG